MTSNTMPLIACCCASISTSIDAAFRAIDIGAGNILPDSALLSVRSSMCGFLASRLRVTTAFKLFSAVTFLPASSAWVTSKLAESGNAFSGSMSVACTVTLSTVRVTPAFLSTKVSCVLVISKLSILNFTSFEVSSSSGLFSLASKVSQLVLPSAYCTKRTLAPSSDTASTEAWPSSKGISSTDTLACCTATSVSPRAGSFRLVSPREIPMLGYSFQAKSPVS